MPANRNSFRYREEHDSPLQPPLEPQLGGLGGRDQPVALKQRDQRPRSRLVLRASGASQRAERQLRLARSHTGRSGADLDSARSRLSSGAVVTSVETETPATPYEKQRVLAPAEMIRRLSLVSKKALPSAVAA